MPALKPRLVLPDVVLGVIVALFVAVPFVGAWWMASQNAVSTVEKRKLAKLPALPTKFSQWRKYPKAFDAFATDRFGLRPQLLEGYKWIVASVFHTSISERAMVGRHGWLYVTGSGALDDMAGTSAYTPAALQNAVQQINARGELLAVRRIPYGFVVFPDKHTVYPQFLPRGLYAGFGHRRLNALDAAMAATGHPYYFDASSALRADAPGSPFQLYYKSDTHWNPWGAYLGYKAWFTTDGQRLGMARFDLTFDDFRNPHRLAGGDLYLMSGYRPHDLDLWPPAHVGCEHIGEWKVSTAVLQRVVTIPSHMRTAECGGSGTALMIHDSFLDSITQYVTAGYQHSWLVWQYPDDAVFGWLVKRLQPSVVMIERVERLTVEFPPTDLATLVRDLGVVGEPAAVGAGGRLRIGSSSDAFARSPVDVVASMDLVTRRGDQVRVVGWARTGARCPAAVIAVADGRVVGEAPVTWPRPDVAAAERNPNLAWSGFQIDIPVSAIRGSRQGPQIYFVNFDDYGAYRASGAFTQRLHAAAGLPH